MVHAPRVVSKTFSPIHGQKGFDHVEMEIVKTLYWSLQYSVLEVVDCVGTHSTIKVPSEYLCGLYTGCRTTILTWRTAGRMQLGFVQRDHKPWEGDLYLLQDTPRPHPDGPRDSEFCLVEDSTEPWAEGWRSYDLHSGYGDVAEVDELTEPWMMAFQPRLGRHDHQRTPFAEAFDLKGTRVVDDAAVSEGCKYVDMSSDMIEPWAFEFFANESEQVKMHYRMHKNYVPEWYIPKSCHTVRESSHVPVQVGRQASHGGDRESKGCGGWTGLIGDCHQPCQTLQKLACMLCSSFRLNTSMCFGNCLCLKDMPKWSTHRQSVEPTSSGDLVSSLSVDESSARCHQMQPSGQISLSSNNSEVLGTDAFTLNLTQETNDAADPNTSGCVVLTTRDASIPPRWVRVDILNDLSCGHPIETDEDCIVPQWGLPGNGMNLISDFTQEDDRFAFSVCLAWFLDCQSHDQSQKYCIRVSPVAYDQLFQVCIPENNISVRCNAFHNGMCMPAIEQEDFGNVLVHIVEHQACNLSCRYMAVMLSGSDSEMHFYQNSDMSSNEDLLSEGPRPFQVHTDNSINNLASHISHTYRECRSDYIATIMSVLFDDLPCPMLTNQLLPVSEWTQALAQDQTLLFLLEQCDQDHSTFRPIGASDTFETDIQCATGIDTASSLKCGQDFSTTALQDMDDTDDDTICSGAVPVQTSSFALYDRLRQQRPRMDDMSGCQRTSQRDSCVMGCFAPLARLFEFSWQTLTTICRGAVPIITSPSWRQIQVLQSGEWPGFAGSIDGRCSDELNSGRSRAVDVTPSSACCLQNGHQPAQTGVDTPRSLGNHRDPFATSMRDIDDTNDDTICSGAVPVQTSSFALHDLPRQQQSRVNCVLDHRRSLDWSSYVMGCFVNFVHGVKLSWQTLMTICRGAVPVCTSSPMQPIQSLRPGDMSLYARLTSCGHHGELHPSRTMASNVTSPRVHCSQAVRSPILAVSSDVLSSRMSSQSLSAESGTPPRLASQLAVDVETCSRNAMNISYTVNSILTPDENLEKNAIFIGGHPAWNHCDAIHMQTEISFDERLAATYRENGWLASDEMHFYIQLIRQRRDDVHVSPVIMWCPDRDLMTNIEGSFELYITNRQLTIMPFLIKSHWCALEIDKRSFPPHVTLVQWPDHLVTQILHKVAAAIQIPPHRLTHQVHLLDSDISMCGWTLLHKWHRDFGLEELIRLQSMNPTTFHDQVMHALRRSQRCWTRTNADQELREFASQVRTGFLVQFALGNPDTRVSANTTMISFAGANEEYVQRSCLLPHVITQNDIEQDIHTVLARSPAWMSSMEVEGCLRVIRLHDSTRLFPPRLMFVPETQTLVPSDGCAFSTVGFDHVTLLVLVHQHWIMVTLSRAQSRWCAFIAINDCQRPDLPSLHAAISHIQEISRARLDSIIMPANTFDNMCGWTILFNLCQKYGIPQHAPVEFYERRIAHMPHAQAKLTALALGKETWTRCCPDQGLRIFAEITRARFLAHCDVWPVFQQVWLGGHPGQAAWDTLSGSAKQNVLASIRAHCHQSHICPCVTKLTAYVEISERLVHDDQVVHFQATIKPTPFAQAPVFLGERLAMHTCSYAKSQDICLVMPTRYQDTLQVGHSAVLFQGTVSRQGSQFVVKIGDLESGLQVFRDGLEPESQHLIIGEYCSGAFSGWTQAGLILERMGLATETRYAIDHDVCVANCYAANYMGDNKATCPADVFRLRDECFFYKGAQIVFQTDVRLGWWLFFSDSTHIATASPPCPAFSAAGASGGLERLEGLTIIETILKIMSARPKIVLIEEVATLKSHPHYAIVQSLMQWGGYTIVWEHVANLSDILPQSRPRLLIVAKRVDAQGLQDFNCKSWGSHPSPKSLATAIQMFCIIRVPL